MQHPLFATTTPDSQRILGPEDDGDVVLHTDVMSPEESWTLFEALTQHIAWQQRRIKVYGKWHVQPRLVAWYGDPGVSYSYSGDVLTAEPWIEPLLALKALCERVATTRFNSVLLNRYRDGEDAMGWHADNEPELGEQPVIASVSLGCERRFDLRHRARGLNRQVVLPHGSVLIMAGTTQQHWVHQIARSKKITTPRINLTYRWIHPPRAR